MAIAPTIVILMTAILQDTRHQCQEDIPTIDQARLECTLAIKITVTDIQRHRFQIVTPAVTEIGLHSQAILMIGIPILMLAVTGTDIPYRPLEYREQIGTLHRLVRSILTILSAIQCHLIATL